MKQNFETRLLEAVNGRTLLRCAFDEDNIVYIDVSNARWSASHFGIEVWIDWDAIELPPAVRDPIQQVARERLELLSPSWLSKIRTTLENLSMALRVLSIDVSRGFGGVTSGEWLSVWKLLPADSRAHVRALLGDLSLRALAGIDRSMYLEMKSWKARNEVQVLRDVLEWNPKTGSLTTAEAELLRQDLEHSSDHEPDDECAVRLFGWICFSLLKRTSQLLSMKSNALRTFSHGDQHHYFLLIPKAKGQSGEEAQLWQITTPLALAIKQFSDRPAIRKLQEYFDRLIVFPPAMGGDSEWMTHGQVSAGEAGSRLRRLVERRGLISPRTGSVLHVTPLRLRHTGATAMAKQGKSREEIQDVLEHDSPFSAQAYIDSIAEDLLPLHEASNARLGEVFAPLRDAYFFRGSVTKNVGRKPISIPLIVEGSPLSVVGGCGKLDGLCQRHPFLSCYDGCEHFLAWREGPHDRALRYVEAEFQRWNQAETGEVRSKAVKDFDRIAASIREVIHVIETSEKSN